MGSAKIQVWSQILITNNRPLHQSTTVAQNPVLVQWVPTTHTTITRPTFCRVNANVQVPVQAMKTYAAVEVRLQSCSTSALDGGEWSASCLDRLTLGGRVLGIHLIRGWVDPQDIHGRCRGWNHLASAGFEHWIVQRVVLQGNRVTLHTDTKYIMRTLTVCFQITSLETVNEILVTGRLILRGLNFVHIYEYATRGHPTVCCFKVLTLNNVSRGEVKTCDAEKILTPMSIGTCYIVHGAENVQFILHSYNERKDRE
jgi:hypothetical protein